MYQILESMNSSVLHNGSVMVEIQVSTYFHNPQESFKNFPCATEEEITMYCLQNDEDYYKVKVFFDLINNAYNNRG